tara:strand:- start:35857 stop:37803 length:1947 start_codon:yes stop_codon:yes gene_type:complete
MGIKKYIATKDNTITNAFGVENNLSSRATGSNMGASDILEVFSIYGQQTTSSAELSRVLVQFPIDSISTDRAAGKIPASGSANFYLRLFNARHSEQLPKNFNVSVQAVSASWQEGYGLDMESYTDETKDGIEGSNWVNAGSTFTAATATLVLQGGANLASMDAQTFVLTDASGVSQTFTFDFDGSINSAGTIGFTGDSNTTQAIDSIKTAINNVSALGITAGTVTAAGDSDSQMTLALTQDATGLGGNTYIDVSGVTHLSSTGFSGGTGQWVSAGGDYFSGSYVSSVTMPKYTYTFNSGGEDMLLDVTEAVEEWIAGNKQNYGFGIFLSPEYEAYTTSSDIFGAINTGGSKKSFYTKRFFSRSSEFFFKKPALEARWDSRISDDRGNFYYSSSLAPAQENLNTVYLYNYVRGQLRDIPGTNGIGNSGKIYLSIYSGSADDSKPSGPKLQLSPGGDVLAGGTYYHVTGGHVSTGIYSASFAFTGSDSLKTIYDVWHNGQGETILYSTGSIKPKTLYSSGWNAYPNYTTKITNLKQSYSKEEQARFRVFTRDRNSSPTIYNVATSDIENTIIHSASFKVLRMIDERCVIEHSTGSAVYHTYLSYDNSGSYFDLDMSLLEPGYMYGVKFAYHSSDGWREQEEVHKFRVENN